MNPISPRTPGLIAGLAACAALLAACAPPASHYGSLPASENASPGYVTPVAPSQDETSGAGGGLATPAVVCNGDVAYWATATAFVSPTHEALASALDTLVFPYDARPLSVVIHATEEGLTGAVSATEHGDGVDVFPADEIPDLGAISAGGDGLAIDAPQAKGYLHLADEDGPVDLALENLHWEIKIAEDCASSWVLLDAVIPASQASIELHLPSGTTTLGELAGDDGSGDVEGYPVRAWFQGESMVFDFASLEGGAQ